MKLSGAQIDRLLQNPDDKFVGALFYGPDRGLVRERCTALGKSIVPDLNDPFSVVEFDQATLKEDPARLDDEARAMAFGGGKRLVRLRDISDASSKLFQAYFDNPATSSFLILDAGELTAKSSLRKLFVSSDTLAAIACYPDEGLNLAKTAERMLLELGVSADQDALNQLSTSLGSDRGMIRQELEKLALYVGENNRLTLDDVMQCLTDSASVSLDQLAYSVGDANLVQSDTFYQKSLAEGMSEIAVLRILQRHFQKLDVVVSQIEQGKSSSSVIAGLRPPIFFKYKDRFERQVRRWSPKRTAQVLRILTDAEAACKSTGTPVQLVCGRAIIAACRCGS